MKFLGPAFRAHDPKWSFTPLSGDGAALHGGRFNPKGMAALYLGLSPMTAVKEANQGFANKIQPLTLCSYDVDCEDIEDLTDPASLAAAGGTPADLACGWLALALSGQTPPSWVLAERLYASGTAGVIVPSFAPGADGSDRNLVLWRWDAAPPHQIAVYDPSGRLPSSQLSWP